MGRSRLEKSKPITPYSTRKEPNRKKTNWKTDNEMERCNKKRYGRTMVEGGTDWKVLTADQDDWKVGCKMGWS